MMCLPEHISTPFLTSSEISLCPHVREYVLTEDQNNDDAVVYMPGWRRGVLLIHNGCTTPCDDAEDAYDFHWRVDTGEQLYLQK